MGEPTGSNEWWHILTAGQAHTFFPGILIFSYTNISVSNFTR